MANTNIPQLCFKSSPCSNFNGNLLEYQIDMKANLVDQSIVGLDLDIRKSRNGRFMDQKLTHDNLSFIADCILNFVGEDHGTPFTTRDIWDMDYFCEKVVFVYNKPDPKNEAADNEYDKFINQPLRLLANAGVLADKKVGTSYSYTIQNHELLEYIALNNLNAFDFLAKYLTKVLSDSGEIQHFDNFEKKSKSGHLTNDDLADLRNRYAQFIQDNTPINGDFEPNRVFNKILNILAIKRRIQGAKRGRITEYPMILKDLEYNAVNWRDIEKRKDLTRDEAIALKDIKDLEIRVSNYEMQKAKDAVRRRHGVVSEVSDEFSAGMATQVHHIFPDYRHPEYRATLENLILLTPTQHQAIAHPGNKTILINRQYQVVCLVSKLDSILSSENSGDGFYSLNAFRRILLDLMPDLGISENSDSDAIRAALTGRLDTE